MLIFIYIHLWYDVEQWRMSTVGEIERDDSIKEGLVGEKIGPMCYQIKKHQKKISGAKWFKSTMIHLIAHLCEYFVISFMDSAKRVKRNWFQGIQGNEKRNLSRCVWFCFLKIVMTSYCYLKPIIRQYQPLRFVLQISCWNNHVPYLTINNILLR